MPKKLSNSNFYHLLNLVKTEKRIFIQTHNFPDHDAVASARALQILLAHFHINTYIVYDGSIDRNSLKRMINDFHINIHHYSHFRITEQDKIIIVDGCKGNRNVTDLIGEEIAVIDHHPVKAPDDVALSDIRSNFGACATILFTYYQELEIPIDSDLASILMIAIHTDTAGLTRHSSRTDILAYAELNDKANILIVTSILRNYRHLSDLPFYEYIIRNIQIHKSIAFCHFFNGCSQNLLGILGDFLLSLDEIDFVILSAHNNKQINLSLRSENSALHCGFLIAEILQGIGFGGGHAEMAGGIIPNHSLYDSEIFFRRFIALIDEQKHKTKF